MAGHTVPGDRVTSAIIPTPIVVGEKPAPSKPIDTGGWYPPVDPTLFRAEHRVAANVTEERVRQALIAAIIGVSRDLANWKARQTVASLALVATDLPTIDGENALVLLYRRAVSTAAKAELVERYRDIELTPAGQRSAEALEPSVGELRRDSVHAIRDILNVGRATVELI